MTAARLDAMRAAFDRGDYRAVRTLAQEILAPDSAADDVTGPSDASDAKSDASDAIKAEARAILRRTTPHPLAKYMFLLAAILLAVLSFYWLGESKKAQSESRAASGQAR